MPVPGHIVDRMRSNLRAAAIPFDEADLQGIVEGPSLEVVAAFDQSSADGPDAILPDYLFVDHDAGAATAGERPPASGAPAPRHRHQEIAAVAARLRAGEVSPVDLAGAALARIAERDPELNAFQLVLGDRALAAARRAEREIAAGKHRGPLHGVPIAAKDLLDMTGTATTAGSRILAGRIAAADAAAVERLEAAGAVIVGKTRMSEFAYFPGSGNAHYGPTRNPWNPERDPGGSSSGSAVAVADGMVFGAIGSDTGGSVRIPAALCGIVGLKPTFGRISLRGVVPLSWSLDHLGPLTRTVADTALLLGVLSGEDPRDPGSRRAALPALPTDLDGGVRGLRIGVPRDERSRTMLGSAATWDAMQGALVALEREGAEIVPVDLPGMEELWLVNNAILAVEAAAFHEPWLRSRLDDYGEIPRRRLLAAYAHASNAFVRAQRLRRELRQRVHGALERVDLLAMPAQPEGAPPLGAPGWTRPTGPFNALGWPALTVPVALSGEGLPLGLQLVGGPWQEARVLLAGRVVEASRREPAFGDPA